MPGDGCPQGLPILYEVTDHNQKKRNEVLAMVYVTVKQLPIYHQMTLEEFLFQSFNTNPMIHCSAGNTRTCVYESTPRNLADGVDVYDLIRKLQAFNNSVKPLFDVKRTELYTTFYIPKKSKGLRRIDAPKPELMDALRRLKTLFEVDFRVLYHTSAFAYVKGRCTVDAVRRHQNNESRWFGKFDLSNFFGSTTLDFVMQQMGMIFPFSEVMKHKQGREALERALELAFLNGGLPQGTPISPLITNLMMIPIDHKLANTLHDYEHQNYVYTRYADDFMISSRYEFDINQISNLIVGVLAEFNAPFELNREKTRYGSSAGRNYWLGVVLNNSNQVTVGNKRKRQFQCMLHNYILDRRNGIAWDKHDLQVMYGHYNYFRMVEKGSIDGIIRHIDEKMSSNVLAYIREDLRCA